MLVKFDVGRYFVKSNQKKMFLLAGDFDGEVVLVGQGLETQGHAETEGWKGGGRHGICFGCAGDEILPSYVGNIS